MRSQEADRRNAQLVRVLGLVRDLDQLGGIDLYELAAQRGTTVRTIRRDMAALEELGFQLVEEQAGKRKRWRLAHASGTQRLTKLLDPQSHYLALRVAMQQGGAVESRSKQFAVLEDLSDKIEQAIGPSGRTSLERIEACFSSRERFAYLQSGPDVLLPLVDAIADRRLCRVSYRAVRVKPRASKFEVLPLKLFVHDGSVYLLGYVPKHKSPITLNLRRLLGLQVLRRQAKAPATLDLAQIEQTAFGVFSGGAPTRYVLQFASDVAPYIRERLWHASQKLRELPDDGVELTFTCGESYEVSSWVASWRQGVTVIEPQSLRGDLRSLGTWLTAAY